MVPPRLFVCLIVCLLVCLFRPLRPFFVCFLPLAPPRISTSTGGRDLLGWAEPAGLGWIEPGFCWAGLPPATTAPQEQDVMRTHEAAKRSEMESQMSSQVPGLGSPRPRPHSDLGAHPAHICAGTDGAQAGLSHGAPVARRTMFCCARAAIADAHSSTH